MPDQSAIAPPIRDGGSLSITDDGVVMGDGSILIRMSKGSAGGPCLALDDDRDRFVALMSIAGGRTIAADAIRHIEAAAYHWQRGDKALASLRLILADLPRLETPADACRLTLAEYLLDNGTPPADLMAQLGFQASVGGLQKYDPNQPRVPPGHGRESGRFGSTGQAPAGGGKSGRALLAPVGASTLATPEAIAGAAARFAGPLAFVAAMVIPTPNSGGIDEGTIPDMPDVRFRKDGAAGTLKLTANAADGSDIAVYAHHDGHGAYVDVRTGQELGRDHGPNISLDPSAVRAAIDAELARKRNEGPERGVETQSHEPELCPAAGPDKPHGERGLEYEIDVHARVNPGDPTPPGYGYRIWDPGEGKFYHVDDCFKTHGDLIDGDMKPGDFADAKGEEYEKLFAKPFADNVIAKLRKQGERQVRAAAARGARVKWYFAQKGAADFIREDFRKHPFLNEITISHMPSRKGPR